MSNLNTTPAAPSLHDYCFGGNGFQGIPSMRCSPEFLAKRDGVPLSRDAVELAVVAAVLIDNQLDRSERGGLAERMTPEALDELHAFHVELFVARTAEVAEKRAELQKAVASTAIPFASIVKRRTGALELVWGYELPPPFPSAAPLEAVEPN